MSEVRPHRRKIHRVVYVIAALVVSGACVPAAERDAEWWSRRLDKRTLERLLLAERPECGASVSSMDIHEIYVNVPGWLSTAAADDHLRPVLASAEAYGHTTSFGALALGVSGDDAAVDAIIDAYAKVALVGQAYPAGEVPGPSWCLVADAMCLEWALRNMTCRVRDGPAKEVLFPQGWASLSHEWQRWRKSGGRAVPLAERAQTRLPSMISVQVEPLISTLENADAASPVTGSVLRLLEARDRVVLSVGRADGVHVGFRFTVYRGEEYVGKVQVVEVSDSECQCEILRDWCKRSIEPGDGASTHVY